MQCNKKIIFFFLEISTKEIKDVSLCCDDRVTKIKIQYNFEVDDALVVL